MITDHESVITNAGFLQGLRLMQKLGWCIELRPAEQGILFRRPDNGYSFLQLPGVDYHDRNLGDWFTLYVVPLVLEHYQNWLVTKVTTITNTGV